MRLTPGFAQREFSQHFATEKIAIDKERDNAA
jgi:hypothetical protein